MDKSTFIKNISNSEELILIGPCSFTLPKDKYSDSPLLIVDGGINHDLNCFSSNLRLSLGDNDSNLSKKELDIAFPIEKNQSDLKLALDLISKSKIKKIRLYGFLGGRKDHEMINLGELLNFADLSQGLERIDLEEEISIIPPGESHFDDEGCFSVATLEKAKLQITGNCKYQLLETTTISPLSSHGLSNIAKGKFLITNDRPVLVFWNRDNEEKV